MPPDSWKRRGGSDAEYEIYRALWSTGRKEPQDFFYNGRFTLTSPRMLIDVVPRFESDNVRQLTGIASGLRYERVSEAEALSNGRAALQRAIGGR